MHSVIVFSDRCTFKDVALNVKDACIIHRYEVKNAVREIDNSITENLSVDQINVIYDKLYPYTQVSSDVKAKHISDIKASVEKRGEIISDDKNNEICPKCGGKLVLRQAKNGAHAGERFWGCSNYPKCKYIRNV